MFIQNKNEDQNMSKDKSRKHSQKIVDGPTQAPSRSMLRAVGFSDDDFKNHRWELPQLGQWLHHATCILIL